MKKYEKSFFRVFFFLSFFLVFWRKTAVLCSLSLSLSLSLLSLFSLLFPFFSQYFPLFNQNKKEIFFSFFHFFWRERDIYYYYYYGHEGSVTKKTRDGDGKGFCHQIYWTKYWRSLRSFPWSWSGRRSRFVCLICFALFCFVSFFLTKMKYSAVEVDRDINGALSWKIL